MSRHPSRRPAAAGGSSALSLAASALLHAALIAASAWLTRVPGQYAAGGSTELVRFLVPPNAVPRHDVVRERVEWVRIGVPDGWGISDIDGERAGSEVAAAPRRGDLGADPEIDFRRDEALDELLGDNLVFSAVDVDSTVERSPMSGAPLYPPAMLAARLQGEVRAIYVVDSAGRVDSASFRIVSATHPEFAGAVMEAVPFLRFRPAMAGGRPVRQLVEQTFEFRIAPPRPKKSAFRPAPGGRTLADVRVTAPPRDHAASED